MRRNTMFSIRRKSAKTIPSEDRALLEQLYLQGDAEASKAFSDVTRALFLTNGGALVALLTFVGGITQKGGLVPWPILEGMGLFFFGLMATVVASLFSYLVADIRFETRSEQLAAGRLPPHRRKGFSFRLFLAIVLFCAFLLTGQGFLSTSKGMMWLGRGMECPANKPRCEIPDLILSKIPPP